MKLLITSHEREKEFKRLMNSYSEYFWVSAWADADFDCFDILKKYKEKIRRLIIGISFDHTNPRFIEAFIKDNNVRFFKNSDELFHPKLYLFQNNKDEWEVLIGSMNFTSAGLYRNVETLVLISSKEAIQIYNDIHELIDRNWEKADYFNEEELKKYKIAFENQQKRSGIYVRNKPGKIISRVKIMNFSWEDFVRNVKKEKWLKQRIEVLEKIHQLFEQHNHFNLMNLNDRKAIAGFLGSKGGIDWNAFGSMRGAGQFTKNICDNEKLISDALDNIPLTGEINRSHYDAFLEQFKKINFGSKKNMVSPASRLLAMKRPDIFVCFDSKNKKKLCKDFGINSSGMTYDRYWDDIIQRIVDSYWWKSTPPKDKEEFAVWKGRSAFLDSLYYEG